MKSTYVVEVESEGQWKPVYKPRNIFSKEMIEERFESRDRAENRLRELQSEHRDRKFRVLYLNDVPKDTSEEWASMLATKSRDDVFSSLISRKDALRAELAACERRIDEVLSGTLVKCVGNNYGKGCGRETPIRDLVYLRTHWYVEPTGCTGGDYWNEGEGQFVCPCGHTNRLWKDRDAAYKLKHLFRGIVDVYEYSRYR